VQNGFVWGNQIIPILDNQFLPVIGPVAITSDILMEKGEMVMNLIKIGMVTR